MMNRHIRPFHKDDLDQVVAISLRAWKPVFESLKATLDKHVYDTFYPDWKKIQAKAVASAVMDPQVSSWVMESGGHILGFVAAKLHSEDKMGEIHMVAVEPSAQRSGIAQSLCEEAELWMKDSGMAIVMVETGGDPGHAPARATYEHMGYREFPVSRYFKDIGSAA